MAFVNTGCGDEFPCKMNLIELTFLPLLIKETFIDEDFRQPIRTKRYGPPIIIEGQINFGSRQKKFFDKLAQSLAVSWNTPGDLNDTYGYCMFRKKELDKAGYIPKKGDLFVGYENFVKEEGIELLVEEVRPESPLNKRNLLWAVELRKNRNKR